MILLPSASLKTHKISFLNILGNYNIPVIYVAVKNIYIYTRMLCSSYIYITENMPQKVYYFVHSKVTMNSAVRFSQHFLLPSDNTEMFSCPIMTDLQRNDCYLWENVLPKNSVTTNNSRTGMKFDLNSVSSLEMSSSFAAAMPKLLRRRGGMQHPTAGTNRRYSDSGIVGLYQ